jgi:hypothetical protein
LDLLDGFAEPVLAEITRSIQLQFLDTAEIGIGGRQLRDPGTACGGHNRSSGD